MNENLDLFGLPNNTGSTPDAPPPTTSVNAAMLLMMFDEPVTVNRAYIAVTQSVAAGLYLTHCGYMSNKQEVLQQDGWFFRSAEDWTHETGLTEHEQRVARKKLRDLSILEETRSQGLLWMRINFDAVGFHLEQNADAIFGKVLEQLREENRAA